MSESDHTEIKLMQKDIADIKAAIIGTDTHKNDGIIDRLCEVERVQNGYAKIVGIASGVGVFFGALLAFLKDKL